MGLSDIWTWFVGLFSKLFEGSNSRYQDEKAEGRKEKEIEKDTEKDELLEKLENEQLDIILIELEKIQGHIKEEENHISIEKGNTKLDIAHAVGALISAIYKLISTHTSIKKEKATLKNIRMYWSATKEGLLTKDMKDEIKVIDKAFKKLKIDLEEEDELTERKIKLIRMAYYLAMKEEGTESQKGEVKGDVTLEKDGQGSHKEEEMSREEANKLLTAK